VEDVSDAILPELTERPEKIPKGTSLYQKFVEASQVKDTVEERYRRVVVVDRRENLRTNMTSNKDDIIEFARSLNQLPANTTRLSPHFSPFPHLHFSRRDFSPQLARAQEAAAMGAHCTICDTGVSYHTYYLYMFS
jgi:hypothetical protein